MTEKFYSIRPCAVFLVPNVLFKKSKVGLVMLAHLNAFPLLASIIGLKNFTGLFCKTFYWRI